MSEQSSLPATLPIETVTPQNLAYAVQNIDGMARSMEAMIRASELPENQAFADKLLERALQVYEIGAAMNAASPV